MYRFMDEDWFQVTFVYHCDSSLDEGVKAYVAGDFCGWQLVEECLMKRCEEGFTATIPLQEGHYKYKFVVDGQWKTDEHCAHRDDSDHDNAIVFVHMDPRVYGIRPQSPPFREYARFNAEDEPFRVHCPAVPDDILAWGVLQRQIYVYLPPSYSREDGRQRSYPAVYMHDGQNVFSTPGSRGGPAFGGMYMDAQLDHFWSCGLVPEFILVAIPNVDFVCIGNRKREYCPPVLALAGDSPFARYMTCVIKPFIESTYRVDKAPESNIVLGASMGGLQAFCSVYSQPEVFGCAVCLSPAFWYADRTDSTCYDLVRSGNPGCRVYLDSGDGDGDNQYEVFQMALTLRESGGGGGGGGSGDGGGGGGWVEGRDFMYCLDEGSALKHDGFTHSEHVWKERVLQALQFAFKC